jgi:hypothetical protein
MPHAWSDLLNATRIDQILDHVKQNPKTWDADWEAVRDAAGDAARTAVRDAVVYAVSNTILDASRSAAWDAVWNVAGNAVRNTKTNAVSNAILALVAWDDCAHLLDTNPEQVLLLARLGHHPAILLYPAVLALKKTSIESSTSCPEYFVFSG